MEIYEYLEKSVTAFHTVNNSQKMLLEAGFQEIYMEDSWNLDKGKYFICPYSSTLFAFTIGEEVEDIKIGMAHTDFPSLKVKPNSEIKASSYLRINVEPYGGLLKDTWFDKPLAVAGKLILKSEDVFMPKTLLVDSEKPLFVIPSLAPHMRGKDKKEEIDVQVELIPLCLLPQHRESTDFILDYFVDKMKVNKEEVIDWDIFLYNADKPSGIGIENELLLSPRLDNLVSSWMLTKSIIEGENKNGINLMALFDHEEVGSRSKSGADSMMLLNVIDKMFFKLGFDLDKKLKLFSRGFMLSIDGAHGLHPNYPQKSDITNQISLGDGIVIKTSASQRYISDSESSGVVIGLCNRENIKYKKQVNRSGMPGGQTLGPIASSYIPIRGADIGIPMLAMHSANELVAKSDMEELNRLLTGYFI